MSETQYVADDYIEPYRQLRPEQKALIARVSQDSGCGGFPVAFHLFNYLNGKDPNFAKRLTASERREIAEEAMILDVDLGLGHVPMIESPTLQADLSPEPAQTETKNLRFQVGKVIEICRQVAGRYPHAVMDRADLAFEWVLRGDSVRAFAEAEKLSDREREAFDEMCRLAEVAIK